MGSTGSFFMLFLCLLFSCARQFHTAIIENNRNTYQDSYLAFLISFAFQSLLYFNQLGDIFETGHNAEHLFFAYSPAI
jgi:hypothetical protein